MGTFKYSSRKLVYNLLSAFFSNAPSLLLAHDEEIGSSVVNVEMHFYFSLQIIENEKDPRGVVQVCRLINLTLTLFPHLSPNTLNDLEMIGIGYFPVTYVTPPLVSGNIDIVTSVFNCSSSCSSRTLSKPR